MDRVFTSKDRADPPMLSREDRACNGADLGLFYHEERSGRTPARQGREALELCHSCVIEQECLRWALETEQEWGTWGGTTQDQRREMIMTIRRRRRETDDDQC